MFEKLKSKWKVGPLQLLWILLTFAIGGSLTGVIGRKLMTFLSIDQPFLWTLLYIIIITICWPLMVLLVSLPFGQFAFFRTYLRRMGNRMFKKSNKMTATVTTGNSVKRIAIFASGAGSNAQKIIDYFKDHPSIRVALIVCNKAGAGVLEIAKNHQIRVLMLEKERFFRGDAFLPELKEAGIDYIVLAGFLWKVPSALVAAFPSRIINIHPALLPKYGGKGMYGNFVHEAVIAAKDPESGISIHFVDEQYDHGGTIFQAVCPVEPDDTPQTLAARIHQLEHAHFAPVIEKTILRVSADA